MNSVFKLSNIFMILLGNAAMALGIVMFILPNGLMTGGTTGLSLIVGHYTSLPISAFVFLFNAVMFILGLVVLGRAFAMTTLLSTFFYPVALEFFQRIPAVAEGITGDRLLSSLFGGLFIGFALGIVIRAGASTGGMDIPPLILVQFAPGAHRFCPLAGVFVAQRCALAGTLDLSPHPRLFVIWIVRIRPFAKLFCEACPLLLPDAAVRLALDFSETLRLGFRTEHKVAHLGQLCAARGDFLHGQVVHFERLSLRDLVLAHLRRLKEFVDRTFELCCGL